MTDEEDAAITAAALSDPDCPPLTDDIVGQMQLVRKPGRPLGSGNKEQVTIRLDTETLKLFRTTGDGGQTRIDMALKEWLQEHHL